MGKKNPSTDEPNPVGRPKYQPTERERGQVEAFTIAGYTQDQIAERLDIDPKTLREHFRKQLDFSRMDVIAGVSGNAVRAAIGAPAQYDADNNLVRAEVLPQPWAICFILKTLGKKQGWSERREVTGPDGGPIQTADVAALAALDDDELEHLERIQQKIAAARGDQS